MSTPDAKLILSTLVPKINSRMLEYQKHPSWIAPGALLQCVCNYLKIKRFVDFIFLFPSGRPQMARRLHFTLVLNRIKQRARGKGWNAMGYYRVIDREDLTSPIFSNSLVSRYAWLEHERGIWHFLTDLFAGPEESTRRWSNKQHALNELIKEGWTIVGSYPENPSTPQPECGGSRGYGLMRVDH